MLQLSALRKSFYDPGRGQVRAVDGVDLQLGGGAVAVMGANGAGKTTLLRLMAGLLEPDEGTVTFAGLDSVRDAERYRSHVGFLAASTKLPPLCTPRELLVFVGQIGGLHGGELQDRVMAMADRFGIGAVLDQRIKSLSTGQCQRVNLARTLLCEPKLLILDEPTTGLDVVAAAQLVQTVRDSRRDDRLILYCTHVPAEAEAAADQLLLLRAGQVAHRGPVSEVGAGLQLAERIAQLLAEA